MRLIPSAAGYRLASTVTAGLLAILACSEGVESPSAPGAEAPELALTSVSNTWAPRAPLGPQTDFAVGAAPNAAGQWFVHVFGGEDDGETNFSSEKYNVETNTWGGGFGAFIMSHAMNGVGKIGNRLYITGGSSSGGADVRTWNSTWAYDIKTDRLFNKADMPRATYAGVTGVIKGKLYVLAGSCSGESVDPGHCIVGGPVRQFYRYDPVTDTWINRRQPPHLHTFGAAAVLGDKLYVVGGHQGSQLDVYDPVTNTWTTRAPIPTRSPRLNPEGEQIPASGERQYAAVIQNRIFVVVLSHFVNGKPVVKAFSYDPVTNTWKSKAAPPIAGPIVRVQQNGQARLFLPGNQSSYMYTP